jgi:GDP-L-fucose synthase
MPTNLYGPGDNFDLQTSHVIPALMRRIDEARRAGASNVEIWGTGEPRREFLHVDDLADAVVFLLGNYSDEEHVNVGTGTDVTIAELARLIADVVGYSGEFAFDTSKPDGTPRKLLDVSRLTALGWRARMDLRDGLAETHAWFRRHAGTDLRR